MANSKMIQTIGAALLCLSGAMLVLHTHVPHFRGHTGHIHRNNILAMTPWTCVGGCGAGGSGGAASTVKWIGKGVSGGLIDLQLLNSQVIARDYRHQTLTPRFSFKPTYTTQAAITLPVVSKLNAVQISTLLPRSYEYTGGIGDLSLDGSLAFGLSGEYSLQFSLSLPTGQFDVTRGSDATATILPSGAQPGSGLWSPGLLLSYTMDVEGGLWLFDLSYSHPMAVSFSGKNAFLSSRYRTYADSFSNTRFHYHFKPYGENDLGDYLPPSVSATVYFGGESVKGIMQSGGLSLNVPVGVTWVHEEQSGSGRAAYNPRPDPDNKAWTLQLSYGLELSNWYPFDNGGKKFPIFLAVAKPLHDKKNPSGRWLGPDWPAFVNEWSLYAGIKATLF